MGRNEIPVPRIELPADWTPAGVICVKVPAPDDPEFIGHLIGLIDILRYSATFERDETREGASTVARTWRSALATQPIVTIECEDSMYLLRQNPDNPCQLQQSTDGGDTWTLAYDSSLCGGPVATIPPFDDAPEGALDAAGNAIKNIYQGLLNLNPDCSISREDFILAGTNYMRMFDPNFTNPTALGGVYDAFCALDETEREEAMAECPYTERADDIKDCYDGDGLISDLNCLAEKVSDWLNTAASDLGLNLDLVAGALGVPGWQNAAYPPQGGAGGGGGGGGFGSECGDWEYTFDFEVSDGSDLPGSLYLDLTGASTVGLWIDGVGWSTDSPENDHLRVQFTDPIGFNITYMRATFECDAIEHKAQEKLQLATSLRIWAGGPDQYWPDTLIHRIHSGTSIEAGHPVEATSRLIFEAKQYLNYPDFPPDWANTILKTWRIVGTGRNPFVA